MDDVNDNDNDELILRCPECKEEIDPILCWCGDEIKRHGIYCGHSPVPMGCTCGFGKPPNNK